MPQTFCFLVSLGKPYGPVARGKSIRNHPFLRSDEYGQSMGVLVYFGHMDASTRKCILQVP